MESVKVVKFSRFTEVHRYNWIGPVGGFYNGNRKVRFSRFEEIHRYEWKAPIGGFQTKLEFTDAVRKI
jgi:hypothetical protein